MGRKLDAVAIGRDGVRVNWSGDPGVVVDRGALRVNANGDPNVVAKLGFGVSIS